MSNPLSALVRAYELQVRWTMELPHLGLPGVGRHEFGGFEDLDPLADVEFSTKTKDPTILCVERVVDGRRALHPIMAGCSGRQGRKKTAELVRKGVHPLDIIVATWDGDTGDFVFRSSVDHLFWTADDQRRLDRELITTGH